jgi:hypothetical protein
VRLVSTFMLPKDTDKWAYSEPIGALQSYIDAHLCSVWKLIQDNRGKGRYKLRAR